MIIFGVSPLGYSIETGEITIGTAKYVLRTNAAGIAVEWALLSNDNLAANAAIAFSKLAALTSAHILVGNGSNVATDVAVSNDATISNTGALTIANDAVTLAKMASGTAGNLITYNAAGDPAAVATGNAAQVLTSNGAGEAPTFQAAAGGGGHLTLIETKTITAETSKTWSSLTARKMFVMIGYLSSAETDHSIYLQFNGDTAAHYDDYYLGGVTPASNVSSSNIPIFPITQSNGAKQPFMLFFVGNATGDFYVPLQSVGYQDGVHTRSRFFGVWHSGATTTISSITLSSNKAFSGKVSLYYVGAME